MFNTNNNNFIVDPYLPKSEFGEYNITYYFLFPLLNLGKYFPYDKKDILVNCFLKDYCRKDTIKNKLLMVLKRNQDNEMVYDPLHKNLLADKNCIYSYYSGQDIYGNDLYTYVFTLDENYKKYYHTILKGQYSKLDNYYCLLILRSTWLEKSTKALIKKVITKDQGLKKQIEERIGMELDNNGEIWTIISKERETFKKC